MTNTTDKKPTNTDVIDSVAENAITNPNPTDMNATSNVNSSHSSEVLFDPSKLGILNDVTIVLTIEVGRAQIKIKDLLNLTKDSIIDLNKLAGEPVDIYANGKLISKGNIITANGKYCVRLTSVTE